MAQPDIIRGTYFVLAMGDSATPTEAFVALCGINTKTFTRQADTSAQFIKDCDDPEDVPIQRLIVTGKKWSLSGEGTLNRSDLERIYAAWAVTKNYRFYFTEPTNDEVYRGYNQGPGIMVTITETGGDDAYATISLQIESDGQWDWIPTAGS